MKTIVMLRNNDTPDYDYRMRLQRESLEKAGYNVYQIFIRYENGLNMWCLNDRFIQDCKYYHESENDLISKTMNYCAKIKPLAPFRNYLALYLMYKYITTTIPNVDVVHAHNLDTMPLAIKLKQKYKCKIVYDMREMYAHMAGRGFSSVVSGYYLNKEKRMQQYADWIFIMEDLTYDWCRKMSDTPISIVMNSRPLLYKKYKDTSKKPVEPLSMLFLGTISQPRFVSEAIDIVEKFKGRVKFYIGGCKQSDPYYQEVVDKCKTVKHSEFIGKVPCSSVVPMTRQCDVVFCMLDPEQYNNSRAIANKQLESMVAGRPIITSEGSYAGTITKENNCGLTIEHCKGGLYLSLHVLLNSPAMRKEMGRNALKVAKEKYNWSIDEERMLSAYKEVLK